MPRHMDFAPLDMDFAALSMRLALTRAEFAPLSMDFSTLGVHVALLGVQFALLRVGLALLRVPFAPLSMHVALQMAFSVLRSSFWRLLTAQHSSEGQSVLRGEPSRSPENDSFSVEHVRSAEHTCSRMQL